MRLRNSVLFSALLVLSPANAQAQNPYNGTWKVSFDGKTIVNLEGTVVVKDDGGSWKVVAKMRSNPCVGREAPIAVTVASADELVFTVNRLQVLTGCRDWTMKFKKVDDRKLAGIWTDGRVVLLARE